MHYCSYMGVPDSYIERLLKANEVFSRMAGHSHFIADNTVIFIGAGTSFGAGLYESWSGLINEFKRILPTTIETTDDYLQIAEAMWEHDPRRYNDIILKEFASPRPNVQKAIPKLIEMRPRFFINTNYDPTLAGQLGIGITPRETGASKVYTFDDDLNTTSIARSSSVHIHGFISEGQTEDPRIILRTGDFEEYYKHNHNLPNFLKDVFHNYNVIFVGFSFGDNYINDILKEVNKESGFSEGARYSLVSIPYSKFNLDGTDFEVISVVKIKSILEKYDALGIVPIWYDSSGDHFRVPAVLQHIGRIMHWQADKSNAPNRQSAFLTTHYQEDAYGN